MALGRAQHNFKQDTRELRIEANMFTNAQGLHLLEPRSRWTCLPAVHESEKWSQHNFKQDAGWFKTSDQGEYVYQSHQYRTYTQTLDMYVCQQCTCLKDDPSTTLLFPSEHDLHTHTEQLCKESSDKQICVRVLCALQGSTFRLMFSHLELTHDHVFKRVCYDF